MEQGARQAEVYDDFSGNELDPQRWVVGQMIHEGQVLWTWRDDNLRVWVEGGRARLEIPEFSLRHEQVQMFDNPKALFCSTKIWSLGEGPISFRTRMGGLVTGDPDDHRDGFASFNVLDFTTGTVLDVISNGNHIWAVYELLDIPGVDKPVAPFTEVVELDVATAPMQEHDVEVRYDPGSGVAEWLVDGKVLMTREVAMNPQSFFLAFGLITLHPLTEAGSVSVRGQGGQASYGPFVVEGAGE